MNNTFIFDLSHLMPDGGMATLRAQENSTRRMSMINGSITGNSATTVSGLSAGVVKNGMRGYASMAECTPEGARAVLRAAAENADFMASRVSKKFAAAPVSRGRIIMPDECFVPIADYDRAAFLREVDDLILKICPDLVGRTLSLFEERIEKNILTADAHSGAVVMCRSYLYVFLTAEATDGSPLERFAAFEHPEKMSAADLESEITALYTELRAKCEGVHPEAGEKTVILGGILSGMLAHEAVGHTVEADLVLGGSVAAHNVDKYVASEKVSLTDFAHTVFGKEAPLPVFMDDEGTPAEDCPIIVNGVLREFMNSRESAATFGMTPRGNARAFSYSDEPLIRMRNTFIHPGKDKLEDMIASVDDGYFFTATNNGQADTTGEFMFGISMGYEIKNGKIGRALRDTTISGVAFDMLKTVDMVSDTVSGESNGYCGKKQPMPVGLGGPEIRCKVMVGGK